MERRFVTAWLAAGAMVWTSACTATGTTAQRASGNTSGAQSGGEGAVNATSAMNATSAAANACVGTVEDHLDGARLVEDPALLARAVGRSNEGKLCAARVFEATRSITVYRVSQADRAQREPGRWWSLARPSGTREGYRAANVICADWSALDVLAQCEVRVGARFVVGNGQSVRCTDGTILAQSESIQVYIDNDTREGRVLVERCQSLGAWPPAN